MPRINDHFLKLKAGYLFPEIGRRVTQFTDSHPEAAEDLIRCGIGDVTEPLPEACRNAIHEAIDELGTRQSFHGYGPEQGYAFLREAIVDHQFPGIGIDADEIFISDGAKCDTGNILDIFGPGNRIAITDPVYPVYVDTNVMAGNTGDCDREGKYQGSSIFPALRRISSFPKFRTVNRSTSSIFATRTIQRGKRSLASSLPPGSPTQGRTIPSSSTMRPMKPSSRKVICPDPSSKSTVPGIVRSSSAPFRKCGIYGSSMRLHDHSQESDR